MASLIVVLVVASLGAALIQLHAAITRRQVQSIDNKRALYVAEAGLAEAFMAIAQGKSGNVGSEEQPARFGNGVFWVEAEEDEDSGLVSLVSNGLCGVGRFSVSMVLERDHNSVASLGLFGDRGLSVGSGSVVDGFDSREGSYGDQLDPDAEEETTGGGALLNSNRDVVIEGSLSGGGVVSIFDDEDETRIYGDVGPGPDGAVVFEPGVLITGSTAPNSELARLPAVEIPDAPARGEEHVDGYGSVTELEGSHHYEGLYVDTGAMLQINGPTTLVVDRFVLAPYSRLVIDSSEGKVLIYCTESLNFAKSSLLYSLDDDPQRTALMFGPLERVDRDDDGEPDSPIQLHSWGTYHGLVYAPHNDVTIPSSLRVFGSVVAGRLKLAEGSRVTFDAALASSGIGTETTPRLRSWRIVGLPDVPLVSLRVDPLLTLKIKGVHPTPASEAHLEQDIEIVYLDQAFLTQTYSGPAAEFDWGTISSIVNLTWIDGHSAGSGGPAQDD